ncbi:gamma-aminobutyric acid type B receptor subunit 1-like [Glandiceps talaboti]
MASGMDTNKTIYIGGLFPLNSKSGESELLAAKLAIEHINDLNVLPGYQLTMYHNDTQCDPGVGADVLFDQLYRKPVMVMLLGAACSEVSKHIAQIVPYWNLVMMSYASTSVALTNEELYPTFYRTVAPDSAHNAARTAFLRHFRWKKVAVLFQDEELFSLATSSMMDYFENYSNISIITAEGFVDNPVSQIQKLKEDDARIIIGSFKEKEARQVFCQAYKAGIYGSKYVWIIVGWYRPYWWLSENDTDCSLDELEEAVEGYIAVESLNRDLYSEPSISGLTIEDFRDELQERGGDVTTYTPQTYDAVWTIALVMQDLLGNHNYTYNHFVNHSITGTNFSLTNLEYYNAPLQNTIKDILSTIKFTGLSGMVSFTGPDRKSITVFEQNQGGRLKRIAIYDPQNDNLSFNTNCVPIQWKGGKVPYDQSMIIHEMVHINKIAFISIALLSLAGIAMALLFLMFNCRYRKTKYIKLSSPNLNNLVIIGSILVYLCLILLGINSTVVRNVTVLSIICTVRAFLFSAGFSLAFGSLFIKTYRVYQIFTHANSVVLRTKMLQESRLFLMVLSLFTIDVILIIIWICVDPLHLQHRILPQRLIDEEDTVYIPTIEQCTCERLEVWLGILYAYKGLLLLFGVFLAWETRKVKIEALNDSQYIGMSVYNVMVLSIITVIVSNVIGTGQHETKTFLIVSSFILITTTNTLCLLFLPKIYAIRKSGTTAGDLITTSAAGLEVRDRTCRFLVSEHQDFKEKLFRAEVHNRAFKKELSQLDVRIKILQDELEELLQVDVATPDTNDESDSDIDVQIRTLRESSSSELLINLPETNINNYYEIEHQSNENEDQSNQIENRSNEIRMGEMQPLCLDFEISDGAVTSQPDIYKISPSVFRVRSASFHDSDVTTPQSPKPASHSSHVRHRELKKNCVKKPATLISYEEHEREMKRLRNEIIRLQAQLSELDSHRMVYYV